ncbi:ATP-binding protein [Aureitalea marina]|uniref:histidine kinase n=1 Tax=Aureitalea marina TaxID=930804 RepID=A0A2S7KRF1_9FLAO|nr:ATP-binding protein [Aureitalea marina]PQB05205.1 hypothetical protein BST85_10160 [Aureitalea marina]
MPRNLIGLLILILLPFDIIGQDLEDYRKIYQQETDPQARLVALDSMISKSRRINRDSFAAYSLEYIDLAISLDSVELAGKKLINAAYTLTSIQNEPRKVVTLVDKLLARKYRIDDSFILGGLYLKRGAANFRLDLEQSVKDYQEAIDNYGSGDSLYIADAYLFSGQAYSNLGKFAEAGENYRKSYEYFESLGDYEYMLYAQQGMTTMFSMNGFQEKAMEERQKNIDKIIELDLDKKHLVGEYYNQSLDHAKLGDQKSHYEYLKLAEAGLDQMDEPSVHAILVYARMVDYYSKRYQTDIAADYLAKVEEAFKRNKEDNLNRTQYFGARAAYLFSMEQYDKALKYALQKLEIAKELNYGEDVMAAHELLADIYQEKGDYQKSLESVYAVNKIKDSVYNQSTANSLAYYQTLYDSTIKEKELLEKTTSIELLEKDNRYFRNLTGIVTLISILIIAVIILVRNQLSLKVKRRMQEQFSQELLLSQESERMRISKDLHDGLGQQLLVIKNKLIGSGDQETGKMVNDSIEEVRTISRDLHPFQLQEMGITKAINYTVKQVDEHTAVFISSEIDNIDELFNVDQEVNIYRIVQESLSNMVKHAKAQAGKVEVSKRAENVRISIRDNGVGFDFSEKYNNVKSLGLKTLMERTRFVNGQLKIHSKKDEGTHLEFLIPIP